MDLLSLLPLLDGWTELRFSDDKELTADEPNFTVYQSQSQEQGWLLGATFQSDQPDAQLEVLLALTGGAQVSYDLNPGQLYSLHRTSPNRLGPYVAVYDDTNGIYSVVFDPAVPMPFSGALTATAQRGSADANVNYELTLIKITDEDNFRESLAQVLRGGIADKLNQLLQYSYLSARLLQAIAGQKAIVKVEEVEQMPQIPAPKVEFVGHYEGFIP